MFSTNEYATIGNNSGLSRSCNQNLHSAVLLSLNLWDYLENPLPDGPFCYFLLPGDVTRQHQYRPQRGVFCQDRFFFFVPSGFSHS